MKVIATNSRGTRFTRSPNRGPVNFLNFRYFTTPYRLIVTSVAACVWNCFLSLVQHEYVSDDEPSNVPLGPAGVSLAEKER